LSPRKTPDYFAVSRTLAASYVFIVPLLALHEAGLVANPGTRNGTATIYEELFYRLEWVGQVALNFGILALLCFAIYRTRDKRRHLPGMYAWMFFESALWASSLYVIAVLAMPLSIANISAELTIAIGAGIFEELLFRFGLMGGLILAFRRGLGAPSGAAAFIAAVLSALLFSFAHHEASGIGSEVWDWSHFLLRALLGALLGAVYWWRGLGIVVYTHALYNVAVILPGHG
jgi:membrane protease YdiL (CAAX protease family)